jgi:hypothetical protein
LILVKDNESVNITFINGKKSAQCEFTVIGSAYEMLERLRNFVIAQWDYDFGLSAFELRTPTKLVTIENVLNVIQTPVALTVENLCKGFSSLKANEVKSYAGLNTLHENDDAQFTDWSFTDGGVCLSCEVDIVYKEIIRKIQILSSSITSEYTMREFISPLLISASILVGSVQLFCERQVNGSFANGPVDYLAMYRAYSICVTEAKKLEIDKGIIQNVGQMKACREVFFQYESTKSYQTKRKYSEIECLAESKMLPSSGIVSTGNVASFLCLLIVVSR